MKTYYVVKAGGLLELRQSRFIGQTHPRDVCAVAICIPDMVNRVKTLDATDDVDWGDVCECDNTHEQNNTVCQACFSVSLNTK